MPIVSSQIVAQSPQADGSTLVHERHTDHTGKQHDHQYYAPTGIDVVQVLTLRGQNLGAEIDVRAAVAAEAKNYVIPWSKKEFWLRITPQEYATCSAFALSDGVATYYWKILDSVTDVTPGDPLLIAGLTYFEQFGKLAPGRAAAIGTT